jgi:hypothetical protein
MLLTTPAFACPAWDLACEAREIIRNPEEKAREGGRNLNRQFNTTRDDISRGLDRIDPRITQMGRDLDRMRRDFQASVIDGPTLEQWLIRSRNDAANGSLPIPGSVRQAMQGWFTDDLMNKVTYKIGDNGVLNLANLSIQYGDARAVTLIDVVVFKNAAEAQDMSLWAHELHHVKQFDEWGTRNFAIRYARSWNTVENDAYALEQRYASSSDPDDAQQSVGDLDQNTPNDVLPIPSQSARPSSSSEWQQAQQSRPSQCVVGPMPHEFCWLAQAFPPGTNCSCPGQTRLWHGTTR